MAANEVRFAVEAPPIMKSEYECDLMIEALSRELTAIKVKQKHKINNNLYVENSSEIAKLILSACVCLNLDP